MKSKKLATLLETINNAPIMENSFLILGGGKFGQIAIDYALHQKNLSFLLIIDKEFNQMLNAFEKISNIHDLKDLSRYIQRKFFLQQDISFTSELFLKFFPQYIVPAIPVHVVATIMESLILSAHPIRSLEHTIPHEKWVQLLETIPKDVILKEDYKNGVILVSWAKIDELCPPYCTAPLMYCLHHHRDKPKTITSIARSITIPHLTNFTIESHQVESGLGIIQGNELKKMILDCLTMIQQAWENDQSIIRFLLATTCNCHGIINIFSFE